MENAPSAPDQHETRRQWAEAVLYILWYSVCFCDCLTLWVVIYVVYRVVAIHAIGVATVRGDMAVFASV